MSLSSRLSLYLIVPVTKWFLSLASVWEMLLSNFLTKQSDILILYPQMERPWDGHWRSYSAHYVISSSILYIYIITVSHQHPWNGIVFLSPSFQSLSWLEQDDLIYYSFCYLSVTLTREILSMNLLTYMLVIITPLFIFHQTSWFSFLKWLQFAGKVAQW